MTMQPKAKTDGPIGRKQRNEEEQLLLESSRHVMRTTTALFYGNGFIVSALPLCMRNHSIEKKGGGRERERERKRPLGFVLYYM